MGKRWRVKSGVDRINALPDELLCHILSFLPTESAVCASILSKRWRYLHTLISSIDISINQELYFLKPAKFSQIKNFVVRDLLSRRSIQRFRLEWSRHGDLFSINEWIAALLCRNIQELEFCNKDTPSKPCNVELLPSLFFSETLVVLKLVDCVVPDHCSLEIPDGASLPNLKVLHMRQTSIRDAQLNKLLSSCPVLDDLFLDGVFPRNSCYPCKLDISNATLRRLAINDLSPSRDAVEAVINCPALEYLSCDLRKDQSLVLLAKQCLAEVVIGSPWELRLDYANANAFDVFKEINNVQSLHVFHHALQNIYWCKVDLPLFKNLTYLKLSDSTDLFDTRFLEYLLAQCVVLKTLVFERHFLTDFIVEERNNIKYALEQSRLVGLLCHLKTVKIQLWDIRDAEAEDLMEIIKFFLNNAKILEEMTICIREFPNTLQSKVRTELLKISRVSKKCRVVLNDEKLIDNNMLYLVMLNRPKLKRPVWGASHPL